MNHYEITVDFQCNLYDHDFIDIFSDSVHTEFIGPDQYQVGYPVTAPSREEAYRLAVNLVEAKLATKDVGPIDWTDATVYGESTNTEPTTA